MRGKRDREKNLKEKNTSIYMDKFLLITESYKLHSVFIVHPSEWNGTGNHGAI